MSKRLILKLLAGLFLALLGAVSVAGHSFAKGPDNGPLAPAVEPTAHTLPENQPLIELRFRDGRITSVTGTAVHPQDTVPAESGVSGE
jgi:hypothetical protein